MRLLTALSLFAALCQFTVQPFSSQAASRRPEIRITRPSSGDDWTINSSQQVVWELPGGDVEEVKIELSRDCGASWTTLTVLDSINPGSWMWSPVTPPSSCACKIRLTATGPGGTDEDVSRGCFHLTDELPLFEPDRVIEFSGILWGVRGDAHQTPEEPGANYWSDSSENIWVEKHGDYEELHLKITNRRGRWYCCEVYTLEPTEYGVHRFYLSGRLDELDPLVVAGFFLYKDDCNEMDIEFSRWGYGVGSDNLLYAVQPSAIAGNTSSSLMQLEGLNTTHYLDWQPGKARFLSSHGHYRKPPNTCFCIPNPLESFCLSFTDLCGWEYTGEDVPCVEKNLRIHMNLWLLDQEGDNAPLNGEEVEIVVLAVERP